MKQKGKAIAFIIIGVVLTFTLLLFTGFFGVSSGRLEQDARNSQKIDDSWAVTKSVNHEIGAMIFYNKEADECIFSIYLNRGGFPSKYFFRDGGSMGDIINGVVEFTYSDNGAALLSMNKARINKIEFGNKKVAAINLDSLKPFAVAIPDNCNSIMLYDINGKGVPITNVLVNN